MAMINGIVASTPASSLTNFTAFDNTYWEAFQNVSWSGSEWVGTSSTPTRIVPITSGPNLGWHTDPNLELYYQINVTLVSPSGGSYSDVIDLHIDGGEMPIESHIFTLPDEQYIFTGSISEFFDRIRFGSGNENAYSITNIEFTVI